MASLTWGVVGVCLCSEMQLTILQCQSWHSFPTSTDEFNHIISRCDTAASDDELFILTRLVTCLSEMPSVPGLPSLGEKAYASSEVVLYFCDVFLLRNHCSTRGWELVPEGNHHHPKCLNRPNKPLGSAPLGTVLNWPTGKWLEGMIHLVLLPKVFNLGKTLKFSGKQGADFYF